MKVNKDLNIQISNQYHQVNLFHRDNTEILIDIKYQEYLKYWLYSTVTRYFIILAQGDQLRFKLSLGLLLGLIGLFQYIDDNENYKKF